MITVLIILLGINVVFSVFSVFIFIDYKKKIDVLNKKTEMINELNAEIANMKQDILTAKENPKNLLNRMSVFDLKIKHMEDILSTFNNGFKYQESWMR